MNADGIVVGPGSLYTSILPNLLVEGVASTIYGVNAVRIYVANLMTEPGETDHYTLDDHLRAIRLHAGFDLFDYILVNRRPLEARQRQVRAQGSRPVKSSTPLRWAGRAQIVECDLAVEYGERKIRHSRRRWRARCGPGPRRRPLLAATKRSTRLYNVFPGPLGGHERRSAAPIRSSSVWSGAEEANTHADRHRAALCSDRSWMPRLMRSATCTAMPRCPRHDDREFFAAIPSAQIEDAHAPAKEVGHVPQRTVALEMAQRVVDPLEIVNVDHQQRKVLLLPSRALHFRLNLGLRSSGG